MIFFSLVIHAYCFLLFITSSFFGHLVHLFQENLWSTFKMRTFCINTIAWMMALLFYARHNQYCEIGMYSLFAATEYVFVISNMIFHFQAYYDFAQVHFCTSSDTLLAHSKSIVWISAIYLFYSFIFEQQFYMKIKIKLIKLSKCWNHF